MKISLKLLDQIEHDIRKSQVGIFPQKFIICGKNYFLLEHVFSPLIYDSTEFFASSLPFPKNDSFFEVGIGSGSIALTALYSGCSFAYGIDININAIKNAQLNSSFHGFDERVSFVCQDICNIHSFNNCKLIFWAHPWVNSSLIGKFGDLERSIFDPNYYGLYSFLSLAKKTDSARIFLGFGNTGDYVTLKKFCKELRLRISIYNTTMSTLSPEYTYELLEIYKL